MERRADTRRAHWYSALYVQVLAGILAGVAVGYLAPRAGEALKPLGDAFLKMIKMVIGLVIFCTVVSGMGGMSDLKKVGRVGGKALIYFEVVSTIALLFGAVVANVVRPGSGFDADSAHLDTAAVASYIGQSRQSGVADFLLQIVPTTVIDAFAKGEILPIVFVSVLFGYVLSRLGERGKPIRTLIDATSHLVFGIINILMRLAPLGAFGAMAYTIGKFGPAALGNLDGLILLFYATAALFVFVVLGLIARIVGFSILKFIVYIKDELLIVLGTSSSESALPQLMEKLERLGCSKSVVGLVVPTGYSFNLDGTNIYMTLATLFIAQALGVDLSFSQQLTILVVAMLTSKGASGVTGAGFITLAATLSVVNPALVPGMAIVFSIDKFMSEVRALTNITGNGIATVFVSWWEGELDQEKLHANLDKTIDPSDVETAITTG